MLSAIAYSRVSAKSRRHNISDGCLGCLTTKTAYVLGFRSAQLWAHQAGRSGAKGTEPVPPTSTSTPPRRQTRTAPWRRARTTLTIRPGDHRCRRRGWWGCYRDHPWTTHRVGTPFDCEAPLPPIRPSLVDAPGPVLSGTFSGIHEMLVSRCPCSSTAESTICNRWDPGSWRGLSHPRLAQERAPIIFSLILWRRGALGQDWQRRERGRLTAAASLRSPRRG